MHMQDDNEFIGIVRRRMVGRSRGGVIGMEMMTTSWGVIQLNLFSRGTRIATYRGNWISPATAFYCKEAQEQRRVLRVRMRVTG